MFKVPEEYRVKNSKNPAFNTTEADGNNGMFSLKKQIRGKGSGLRDKFGRSKNPGPVHTVLYLCTASDGLGWEHVSVSLPADGRLATWEEMCQIKDLFWGEEDMVVQYHPAREDYVDNASVLHLWRSTDQEMPKPPSIMVGLKGLGNLENKN